MKFCPYCGCINFRRTGTCRECGTSLDQVRPILIPENQIISPRKKKWLLGGAWALTILAIFFISGTLWPISFKGMLGALGLFPCIAPPAVPVLMWLADNNSFLIFAAVTGWIYYLALSVVCLKAMRRWKFVVVYVILCLSFLFNIAGCEVLKHSSWKTERKVPASAIKISNHFQIRQTRRV
jgi:hypothetical protein